MVGPAGWLVRSANLKCAGAGNPRAVRRFPFAFTQRVRFTDGYRRGRIFHFSTAKALRNGYDSQRRELWTPVGLALRANWIKLPQSSL